MRTLKKTLCLVLALAMVLSLGATAFAADYNDQAEIEHKDAAAVMNAIGVFIGDDNGDFNPANPINRGEAAKVICTMLGVNTSAYAGVPSPFDDVADDHWAKQYIAYCAANNIVSGYGNGRFGPGDDVTGTQFGKMLMGALGYNFDIEKYRGESINGNPSWEIAVTSLMQNNAQILAELTGINLSQPLTRDSACQMAFNTLTATMVYYDNDKREDSVASGTGPSSYVDYRSNAANSSDDTLQFCEAKFPTLKAIGGSDEMGRTADNWSLNSKPITSAATTEPVAVFNTKMKSGEAVKALKALGVTDYASGAQSIQNGANVTGTSNLMTGKIADATLAAGAPWNGANILDVLTSSNNTVVEVYVNEDNEVTKVISICTFMYELTKADITEATDDDPATIKLKDSWGWGAYVNASGTEYEADGFEAKDVVLYTRGVSNGTVVIASAVKAESIEGKLESIADKSGVKSYTIDGETYEASDAVSLSVENSLIGKDVTAYLGPNNAIVKIAEKTDDDKEPETPETNYVWVLNHEQKGTGNTDLTTGTTVFTPKFYGVKSDGTFGTFTAQIDGTTVNWGANDKKGLYTYIEDKTTGNLKLTAVENTTLNNIKVSANVAVGAPSITVNSTEAALNNNSVFLFVEYKDAAKGAAGTDVTVKDVVTQVSSKNIGTAINAPTTTAYAAVKDGAAEVVFVFAKYTPGAADAETTGELVYVDRSQETVVTTGTNTTTYKYVAYDTDGKEVTVTSKTQIGSSAVYELNDDNSVTAYTNKGTGLVTAVGDGSLRVGSTYLTTSDDTTVAYMKTVKATKLEVGQTVYYAATTKSATDVVAIWVVSDKATKEVTITATGNATPTATTASGGEDLSGYGIAVKGDAPVKATLTQGADVENTVEVTIKADKALPANRTLEITATFTTGGSLVGSPVTYTVPANTTTKEFKVTLKVKGVTSDTNTMALTVTDATAATNLKKITIDSSGTITDTDTAFGSASLATTDFYVVAGVDTPVVLPVTITNTGSVFGEGDTITITGSGLTASKAKLIGTIAPVVLTADQVSALSFDITVTINATEGDTLTLSAKRTAAN